MKETPRLIAIALMTVLLLTTLLVGCTGTTNTSTETPKTTQRSTAAATADQGSTPEPTPVVYEEAEVTLNFLRPGVSGPTSGWLDDFIISKTGVHIEFVELTTESMQAKMAGGDLSDIINISGWENYETAVQGNLLLCLDEYLDQIPNAVANQEYGLQFIRDEKSAGTGKAYAIPGDIGEDKPVKTVSNYGPVVRWDIYQAIGAPEVETIEDFLPVIKQMQEYYPQTEDGLKVYGFSMFPDWDGNYAFFTSGFFVLNGHFHNTLANYFLEENLVTGDIGELLDPDGFYLRALKFYFDANQLGLLDPDSITQTYGECKAKVDAGQILTAGGFNWMSMGGAYNTLERMNSDPPQGFNYVIFDEYQASLGTANITIGKNRPTAIGATTEHLEECLRFLNFYTDFDSWLTILNGPQGILWDINEDGELYATDTYYDEYLVNTDMELPGGGALSLSTYFTNGTAPFMLKATHPDYGNPLLMSVWPDVIAQSERTALDEAWTDFYGYDWPLDLIEDQGRVTYRPISYLVGETTPDEITAQAKQIGEIVKTNSWKMVFAANEDEFNALWDEMLTTADGLGIEEIMVYGKQWIANAREKAAKYGG